MFFKYFVILLFISAAFCQNLSEGDPCKIDGAAGLCLLLGKCTTALLELPIREDQICSFTGKVPIVCCVEKTTKRPPPTPELPKNNLDKCGKIIPQKTGKKAFDKCTEYQQKYVYPCERGPALSGVYSSQNNCNHKTNSLIIGGTNASQYEFPHMALLGYEGINEIEWDCGGSIVSERFILTAAHCIYNNENGPVKYVAIGVLSRVETKDTSKIYRVKNNHKHPEYNSPSVYNDIALIETERVMELNQYTVPACLHTGDDVDDDQVLATGWGNTQGDGDHFSDILQRVVLSKVPDKNCSKIFKPSRLMKRGYNDLTQSCFGDRNMSMIYQNPNKTENKDTCKGDSGGPIQIKDQKINCMYTIVGVIANGKGKCGGTKPAIYTRVAHYLPWIEDTVWPN